MLDCSDFVLRGVDAFRSNLGCFASLQPVFGLHAFCAWALLIHFLLVSCWVLTLVEGADLEDPYLRVNFWQRALEPSLPKGDTLKERWGLFVPHMQQLLTRGAFGW